MEAITSAVQTVVSTVISSGTTVLEFCVENPLTLFYIGLGVVGAIFGYVFMIAKRS